MRHDYTGTDSDSLSLSPKPHHRAGSPAAPGTAWSDDRGILPDTLTVADCKSAANFLRPAWQGYPVLVSTAAFSPQELASLPPEAGFNVR